MNIFVSAYLDRNFGDDMFVFLLANELEGHTLFLEKPHNSVLELPFKELPNIKFIEVGKNRKEKAQVIQQMDAFIRIGGSIFAIPGVVTNISGFLATIRYLRTIKMVKSIVKKGVPYIILGCNTGPFT
ncbi:MAG: hypothetical protein IE909_15900, partial [Campylobacterales bacterium]|nr:hypothetical protein [Campylobacterales bacterium]